MGFGSNIFEDGTIGAGYFRNWIVHGHMYICLYLCIIRLSYGIDFCCLVSCVFFFLFFFP